MIGSDVRQMVQFVWAKCDLVIAPRYHDTPEISQVADPALEESMTLWNRDLVPCLERQRIRLDDGGERFHIDGQNQVIELNNSRKTVWNGRAALLQGRIYGMEFGNRTEYTRWFASVQRWVRKSFRQNPCGAGFIGPEAWRFFVEGGVLLPFFNPPITASWAEEIRKQDAIRRDLEQEAAVSAQKPR